MNPRLRPNVLSLAGPRTLREPFLIRLMRALRRAGGVLRLWSDLRRGAPPTGAISGAVVPEAFERLLASLESPDRPLPLTRFERAGEEEARVVGLMARRAALTVIENFCQVRKTDPAASAMRDQHAKPHGVLGARFVVLDDIPSKLAKGVFRPGQAYDAVVRFSNANGVRQSDRKGDGRGMAIKILNAPGPSLLAEREPDAAEPRGRHSQDFLLTSFPVFFCENVDDYSKFLEILAAPRRTWIAKLEFGLRFAAFFLAGRLRQAWIFWRTAAQQVSSPLTATYHSMTPYLLGDDVVVRYVAIPRPAARDPARAGAGDNFLQAALAAELTPAEEAGERMAVFDFAVQVRESATPEDVEDASRYWRRPDDAVVRLARVEIPSQAFLAAKQTIAGENMSFSPWHCLKEHRPLGGLNRMRLAVYRASLCARHRLNTIPADQTRRALLD